MEQIPPSVGLNIRASESLDSKSAVDIQAWGVLVISFTKKHMRDDKEFCKISALRKFLGLRNQYVHHCHCSSNTFTIVHVQSTLNGLLSHLLSKVGRD